MRIMIINGPNLNLVGKREQEIYGDITFEDYYKKLKKEFSDIQFSYFQSNIEGEVVEMLQEAGFTYDGIILNPGGYTHTSVAIADAIAAISTPVIEVHISNPKSREVQRQTSLIEKHCKGTIEGLGLDSYKFGIQALIEM